jgi:hypothetical protein
VYLGCRECALNARIVISLWYEGPWERVMNWLFGIDRRTNGLRCEVADGSVRARAAEWAELRDFAWRTRAAVRWQRDGTPPSRRWKRGAGQG